MTRTGGQLLVEGLRRWGVEVLFGIPGVQLDWFFDAIAEDGSIEVVHTRHEQGAAYMADGYARSTGRVGVCAVVPGPGVLNALAALCTAYATNSPVLCITGHVFGGDAVNGTGALHELPDQTAAINAVIRRSARARTADEVPGIVDEAFVALTAPGRRRPYALEVGPDVLGAPTEAVYGPRPLGREPARPSATALDQAVAALAVAQRPLVYAGGGALDAGPAVAALADHLDAPVVLTYNGRGTLSDCLPRVLPPAAAFALLPTVDAVVAIGSRFFGSLGPLRLAEGTAVVRIDADAEQLIRSPAGTVSLLADATAGTLDLLAALKVAGPGTGPRPDVAADIARVRAAVADGLHQGWPEVAAMADAIRAALPDDGILVDEMTQVGYWARSGHPVYAPRTYIGSGYQGTLGSGFATSLGAKVANPDRVVVSINGDGGFLFTAAELATAHQHGIDVIAVVFDDGAYGNVRGIQQRTYGREVGSSLTNPDWVGLALAFGIAGTFAPDAVSLRRAVADAIERGGPALIHVPIGPQPDMWAVIGGRQVLA